MAALRRVAAPLRGPQAERPRPGRQRRTEENNPPHGGPPAKYATVAAVGARGGPQARRRPPPPQPGASGVCRRVPAAADHHQLDRKPKALATRWLLAASPALDEAPCPSQRTRGNLGGLTRPAAGRAGPGRCLPAGTRGFRGRRGPSGGDCRRCHPPCCGPLVDACCTPLRGGSRAQMPSDLGPARASG